MHEILLHKAIKRSIHILCGLVSLSTTIQATRPTQQASDISTSHGYPKKKIPSDVKSIIQKNYVDVKDTFTTPAISLFPSGQLMSPANAQCLYSTIIMGYLLPVLEQDTIFNARMEQLFGRQHIAYFNKLRQILQNPTEYLTYLQSDAFSTLVNVFTGRMQLKEGTWGGPREIQTIANNLAINIQAHCPDYSNSTDLVQSDLTQPAQGRGGTTLHIVRDQAHPAEVLSQAKKVSAQDNQHHQHYRLKYRRVDIKPMAMFPKKQSFMKYAMNSPSKNAMQAHLIKWFDAARTGNTKLLEKLYNDYNINVDTKNMYRDTSLLLSANNGHVDCVRLLLQQGADINTVDNATSISKLLSEYFFYVGLLSEKGTSIHSKGKNGYTPLLLSAYKGHLGCIKLLVGQQGADIDTKNEHGNTALLLSAYKGHLDCVKYLVQQGADVNTENKNGNTVLILSAENQHIGCLHYLLQQGADLHTKNKNGDTALILSAYNGYLDCVKHLIQQGADLHIKNINGETALISSAYNGHLDCVKFLIQQGDYTNAYNKDSHTALILSAQEGHLDCLKYLLQETSDRHQENKNTALLWSAWKGHLDCVKYLIQEWADLSTKIQDNNTALILSAQQGHLDVVKYLVQQGASAALIGEKRQTALQWAKEKGQKEVVHYLSTLAVHSQSHRQKNEDDEKKADANKKAAITQKYSRKKLKLISSNNIASASKDDNMINIA